MSNVIAATKQLQQWEPVLKQFLTARGIPTKHFDIQTWLRNWLKAETGMFWARNVRYPKVGEVYEVALRPAKTPSENIQSEGYLFDAKLLVKGEPPEGKKSLVRITNAKGTTYFGETVSSCDSPSEASEGEISVYYSAWGVTALLGPLGRQGDMQLQTLMPNERIPTGILAAFGHLPLPEQLAENLELIVWGGRDEPGYRLVQKCPACGGSGNCPNCEGDGHIHPDCRVCGGSGQVQCRKCGGSGHYGNGDCYSCNGSGTRDCPVCQGDGHVTFECRACHGDGHCFLCRGTRVAPVFFSSETGRFTRKAKEEEVEVDDTNVFWHSEEEGRDIPLGGCWHELERKVKAALKSKAGIATRAGAIREECGKILEGLKKKAERDTSRFEPILVKYDGAPPRRIRGRVLYLFRESGKAAWKKHRTEPYPQGTPLRIEGFTAPDSETVVYEDYDADDRTLTLSFPAGMDVEPLKEKELKLTSAEMRPPEVRQMEYLERWMADETSPVRQAIIEGCTAKPARGLTLFNDDIARYATQKKAVALGLSDAPLFLLKGPPGTGKTTIIVEIIRQAVQRGQRVLLTSQTHQAVENVLEKLHGLLERGEGGSIRMVHHTAMKGKASALALQYGEEAGGEEVPEIRKRVENFLSKNKREADNAEKCLETCVQGAGEARQMEENERQQHAELTAIREDLASELEKIAACARGQHAELDGSLGRDIRQNEEACRKIKASLATRRSRNKSAKKGIGELTQRLETYKGGGLKALFVRTMHGFESNERIEGNLKAARRALSQGENSVRKQEADLEEKTRLVESQKEELARREQAIDDTAERERKQAKADARARTEQSRARYEEACAPAIRRQRERIRTIGQLTGATPDLPEFSGADVWSAFHEKTEPWLERLHEEQDVAGQWERLLAENPETVARFIHAQTNVFLATCVGVGGWRSLVDGKYDRPSDSLVDGERPPFFDLVIVDEAGHATFAETVIPISMARRAILIGDDKQLPPMEDDEIETESLFTRLWEETERGAGGFKLPHLMLDTQFRMHPEIAQFVSETFYRGQLQSGVTEKDRAFQFGAFRKAVNLLSTSHQARRHETFLDPSYRNDLEAEYVRQIVQSLIEHVRTHGTELGEVSVAVITPYAEQVSAIRQKLKPFFGTGGNVKLEPGDVASVDKFQGGERDIVIASFVRSPDPNKKSRRKLTFVQDLKRMNVAFSRARRMLILVGDIEALSSGLGDEDGRKAFARFHRYARNRGQEILAWERKEA